MTIITILLAILTLTTTYHWSQCCPLRTLLSSALVVVMIGSITGLSVAVIPCWMALFFAMMFWLPRLEGKRVMWQVGSYVMVMA